MKQVPLLLSYAFESLVHNIDADVDVNADADAGIEMNPIPPSASASTSKDATYIKAVSLMLILN